MRVLAAPDSFKGSLSALEAAEAIRRGVLGADPAADVDVCPVSDGGEGLLEVLAAALGGTRRIARVTGPLGEPVEAPWLFLADSRTAILESAAAIGLGLVAPSARRPTRTTTYGVGELMRAALDEGARTIAVGLGGTATTDGGAGMAQALGAVFDGAGVPITGERLPGVRAIDRSALARRLSHVDVVALVDVDSPLSGPAGAAYVFGPQKGATAEDVALLDAALSGFASLVGDEGRAPGDGAAGGLGYGLRVLAGARVTSGAEFVLDAVRVDARLDGADLVITGEGRVDAQSAHGKIVGRLARRCLGRVPVVVLTGSVGPGADALLAEGVTAMHSIRDDQTTEEQAMRNAAVLLERAAERRTREFRRR